MSAAKPLEVDPKTVALDNTPLHARIASMHFHESITLAGEHTSIQPGRNVDRITPVRYDVEGPTSIGPNQRCDGFVLRVYVSARGGERARVEQTFVSMSQVKQITYKAD